MALSRTHREWSILVSEYNICKKKLQSKREALKILTKEWQTVQRERDIYKNKINQLQQDLDTYILKDKKLQNEKQQSYEAQQNKNNHVTQRSDLVSCTSKDSVSLHLLLEYKVENKALKKDLLELKRLYVESQEDVHILRERMRKQSSSSSIGEESSSSFVVLEGQEDFILQLEEYKEQVASLEQELKSIRDENSDVLIERDHYKDKYERLNTQLNYILGADDRRLVDIDALVLDNKYLKEKLNHVEEERSVEKESIQKYEAVFKKKKDKLLGRGSIGGKRLPSYYTKYSPDHSAKTVSELRDVANILSETITEKNLALSHQRSANSILGKRVSELENKLKTLEVSGLWSLPGHRGYGSLNLENSAKTNGEAKRNETKVEQQDLPDERLEWDNSPSLVELKKAKMEINGNDLRDISEIIDGSEKISRDFKTLDLSPNSVFSDGELSESGCQSICLQGKPCERKGIFSFSSHKNNGILNEEPCLLHGRNSVMEKHSRSNSAPCSFAGNSFDVDDEHSNCDFDAQQFKNGAQNSERKG